MSDLLRFGVAAFKAGRMSEARRLVAVVDHCLSDGDEYVMSAVLVSFVEDDGYGQNEPDSFLTLRPEALRRERGRWPHSP